MVAPAVMRLVYAALIMIAVVLLVTGGVSQWCGEWMRNAVDDLKLRWVARNSSCRTSGSRRTVVPEPLEDDRPVNLAETLPDVIAGKKAVICGIARDVVDRIDGTMASLHEIGRRFEDFRIVVVENDSKDGTAEALRAWAAKSDRVKAITLNLDLPAAGSFPKDVVNGAMVQSNERTKLLADLRNRYLDVALSSEFEGFDYVIVADFDMPVPWRADDIVRTIVSGRSDWDCVCANGMVPDFVTHNPQYHVDGPTRLPLPSSEEILQKANGDLATLFHDASHYDRFAFRSDEFPDGPVEMGRKKYWYEHTKNLYGALRGEAYAPLTSERLKAGEGRYGMRWIPVRSCFGSLAIYRRSALIATGARYQGDQDCEHVGLHAKMRQGETNPRGIFINPDIPACYI